jgi:hypothetical protein
VGNQPEMPECLKNLLNPPAPLANRRNYLPLFSYDGCQDGPIPPNINQMPRAALSSLMRYA